MEWESTFISAGARFAPIVRPEIYWCLVRAMEIIGAERRSDAGIEGLVSRTIWNGEPFFVLGAQRSGTTMLRLMLNNHPRLAVPHETVYVTQFYRNLLRYGDLAQQANMRTLLDDIAAHPQVVKGRLIDDKEAVLAHDPTTYAELIDAIMTCYAQTQGKVRWGDKTPYYTLDIDVLHSIFPHAKFIQIVRDGRDVALSQRQISWCSSNSFRLAEDWAHKTTLCHKVGRVLGPDQYLELRYEELVRDPEPVLRQVCDFLGESFDARMLHYHETAKDVVPGDSLKWHRNSVRAPDASKIFAWKNTMPESERIIFEEIAGPTLEYFGYERPPLKRSVFTRLKKIYLTMMNRW